MDITDQIKVARGLWTFRKVIKSLPETRPASLLMNGLILCLSQQESYDLLEIIEARIHHASLILCTR